VAPESGRRTRIGRIPGDTYAVDFPACRSTRVGVTPFSNTPGDEMRFLSMVRTDEKAGRQPSERLMSEMGKLMEEMIRAGALVSTAGLRPSAEGARVRSRYGQLSTTEGPFAETKEVIGGFAILEAPSLPAAIELTERFLRVHGDEWDIECEVRPLDGPEFGART